LHERLTSPDGLDATEIAALDAERADLRSSEIVSDGADERIGDINDILLDDAFSKYDQSERGIIPLMTGTVALAGAGGIVAQAALSRQQNP
jgi:hypothetical protein